MYFSIQEEEVFPLAERFFLRSAGFDLETPKHRRMYEEAQAVRKAGFGGICVEGFYAGYGAEVYDGVGVEIDGKRIVATAFQQMPAETVKRVVLYIITAGECSVSDDADIMAQLYAHMWGTAYVDAGRILLETKIKEKMFAEVESETNSTAALGMSPGFSPGFYGMENKDSLTIVDLLGAGEIGVSCMDTGVMLPVKTCSGIFLITDGSVSFPGDECLVCIGNKTGCADCMIGNRRSMNV
jgi:hypothetical protein